MDRTLKTSKGTSKRRSQRNLKAWKLLSPGGANCRFCPHPARDHLCSSGQPHFYRPATEEERQDLFQKLYRHDLPDGSFVSIKRITVANQAEIITAYCKTCAKNKDTTQVLCYQRTLGMGEVVGLGAAQENG